MTFDLSGKTILISGGGRGLGRGTAELMAASGAVVGIADIDPKTCNETAEAIRAAGGEAHAFAGDLSDRGVFMGVAGAFASTSGRIDGVVNAAMWIKYEPIGEVSEETMERMLAVGFRAPVWGTQALLRHMDPAPGVGTGPGTTAFTRTLAGPSSTAKLWVRVTMAPLMAA